MADWVEDIAMTLDELGGRAHLSDIYKNVRRRRQRPPKQLNAVVRYYLEQNSRGRGQDLFKPESIGSGVWILKKKMKSVRNRNIKCGSSHSNQILGHDDIKAFIKKLGIMEGFIADTEYKMDRMRLDVVWKRVRKGQPTFAFEVQDKGNIHQALSKLKHAHDLWNSTCVFVGKPLDIEKAADLSDGTFHEIYEHLILLEFAEIEEFYHHSSSIIELRKRMGIISKKSWEKS
jgi:hypothetical protein